jgi:small neutral amino acid transporter SnatA (MarC family)
MHGGGLGLTIPGGARCYSQALELIALTLWMAFRIQRLIGKTGINVATRFMALIVASLGVDFILTGMRNQLPGLTH